MKDRWIFLAAVPVAATCAAAGPPSDVPGEVRPEVLFAKHCVHCHDSDGWGTRNLASRVPSGQAELRKRAGLPAAYVRYAVRYGVGSMPQFTPTELGDADLDRLAKWLESGADVGSAATRPN